jgi:hypothetical protein
LFGWDELTVVADLATADNDDDDDEDDDADDWR